MDQFQTVFMGGYRKEEVDERLKALVAQIETLHQEAKEAAKREGTLKEELAAARGRIKELEAEARKEESRREEDRREESRREENRREENRREESGKEAEPPHKYYESPGAERASVQGEADAQAGVRLLELECAALNRRIMSLEDEKVRREAEYRRETAKLRENLSQQRRSTEAAERILQIAEQEAHALIEEAQIRTQEMERQAEEKIRARVMRCVDTLNITQRRLSQTCQELDELSEQFPGSLTDNLIIDLGEQKDFKNWGDALSERQRL